MSASTETPSTAKALLLPDMHWRLSEYKSDVQCLHESMQSLEGFDFQFFNIRTAWNYNDYRKEQLGLYLAGVISKVLRISFESLDAQSDLSFIQKL